MVKICKIKTEETYNLRHEILRPQQSLISCQYAGDQDPTTGHYGAFDSGLLVGIVSVYKVNNIKLNCGNCWQIRAMATDKNVRNRGYGLLLLRRAERHAYQLSPDCIWANARKNAIGFYEKAGYKVDGPEFVIPDIGPHFLIYRKFDL